MSIKCTHRSKKRMLDLIRNRLLHRQTTLHDVNIKTELNINMWATNDAESVLVE